MSGEKAEGDSRQPSVAWFEHEHLTRLHQQHDAGECHRATCPYCAHANFHARRARRDSDHE